MEEKKRRHIQLYMLLEYLIQEKEQTDIPSFLPSSLAYKIWKGKKKPEQKPSSSSS